ncbi:MAG: hypothetical protein D6791_16305 [Chloroflexi bacterium]|nr:MAG: hypothetical protein D6791_16305 [Chloroflexota bacterium]
MAAFLRSLLTTRGLRLLLLGGILLIGLVLRTYNVDWADGQLPHPDERSTVAFYAPTIKWPQDTSILLDADRSPLNPFNDPNSDRKRSYTYGHFPLYLLVASANLTAKAAPLAERLGVSQELVDMMRRANGVPGFAWVGRWIMALADTVTLLYLYLLGRRIYNEYVGLLAAALGAFTVLQIQLAHFFAVDPISATFTVAAVYHAIRLVDTRGWKQAALTGVMAALAIASKFSALPVLAAPGVAGLIILARQQAEAEADPQAVRRETPGLVLALGAMIVAGVVFAITSPFVLLDFESFWRAVVKEQGAMVRGIADFPFTRQYRGTTPYLYFIEQQVRWGMGWFLGLVGWVAFAWALVKAALRRVRVGELLILSWVVPYFLITGSFLAKFNRYMVPVVPLLTVLGAGMLWLIAGRLAARLAHRERQPAGVDSPVPEPVLVAEPVQDTFSDPDLGRQLHRRLFAAFGLVVLIPTVFWALAFVHGVYGSEHPFIQASKWMYENIPDGSVWITEHWEEGLPLILPIPGGSPGAHNWRNVVMPMYEEDTQAKFEIIKQNMREGDYYVLATKRLYGALPHLPQRYPMSIKFYDLLFSGQLGYELAAEFTAYPRLFGIEFNDQNADESFWVYDHPRTLIYKKVRDLSDAEWEALLGGTWETAIPGYTGRRSQDRGGEVSGEETSKPSLLLERPVDELPSVGRVAWAPWRDSSLLSLLIWWLALLGLQVISWPLAFTVFGNLRDQGYGFARGLGLLVVAWVAWILPALHIITYTIIPVLLASIVLGAISYGLWRRRRQEMLAFLRVHRPLVLLMEGVFSAAFLLFVFIRLLNPDLWQPWQGGEKFMEFAFLNAVTRTPYFPPYDPYFAGGWMNYYYYGYQVLATLIKLTGIRATIAFNLAIPTLFALTATGVFSLVYSLAPRPALRRRLREVGGWWKHGIGAALVGVFFVALMGNLDGGLIIFRQVAERSGSSFQSNIPLLQSVVRTIAGLGKVLAGQVDLPGYNYWDRSRVIPFTINEFPFWSFLFADLHPHMMGIPFTVLFLALAYNLVAGYGQRWNVDGRWEGAAALLALPMTLGAIGAINTWDLPTYLGVGVVAWGLREWKGHGRLRPLPTVGFVVGLAALAYGLYLPFYRNYTPVFNTGVGLTYMKTDLGAWLRIWGFFIFVAISFVLIELRRRPGDVSGLRWLAGLVNHFERLPRFFDFYAALVRPGWDLPLVQVGVGAVLVVGVVLAFLGYTVVALLLPLVLLSALFLFRRNTSAEAQFRALLFFTGLLVLLGVEIFYLKDFLCGCGEGLFARQHGDYYRMNTLFKFYIQVWVMLGIASAASLPYLFEAVLRWQQGWRQSWMAALAVLVTLGMVFPILGTASRVDDRFPGERPPRTTLDGMAFMRVGTYFWPDGSHPIELKWDYEAIRWLQENVTGTPVVAEAPASWYTRNGQNYGYDYYRAGGLRAASLTGLPTFLGQHQGEQRYGSQTGLREQLAREFWQTTDIARLRQLIDELHVGYVYVGQLERILFSPEQIAKFDVLVELGDAEIAFQNEGVTIYRILR